MGEVTFDVYIVYICMMTAYKIGIQFFFLINIQQVSCLQRFSYRTVETQIKKSVYLCYIPHDFIDIMSLVQFIPITNVTRLIYCKK